MGIVGWVVYSGDLSSAGVWNAVPTVALAGALADAVDLRFNVSAWVSLAVWTVLAIIGAVRLFRFDD